MTGKTVFSLISGIVMFVRIATAQISPEQKDSLIKSLPERRGIEKIHTLDRVIRDYYVYNELDSVDYYAGQLLDLSIRQNLPEYTGNAYYYKALGEAYSSRYSPALKHLETATQLHQSTGCRSCSAWDYNLYALIFSKNDKPKDFEYGFQALKWFESEKDTAGIIKQLFDIGTFYAERENIPMFRVYINKIRRYLKQNPQAVSPSFHHKIQAVFYSEKAPDSTLYYLNSALAYDRHIQCRRCLTVDYHYLAMAYLKFGMNKTQAAAYYRKALEYSMQSFVPLTGSLLTELAQVNYSMHQYKKAIRYAREAYDFLLKEKDWDTLELTSGVLFQSYKSLQMHDSAYVYIDNMLRFRDSLHKKKIEYASLEMHAQYEDEKKQLQIEKLTLKQQKNQRIQQLLSALLLLVLVTSLLLWNNARLKRQKLRLTKEKIAQELRHKSKELTTQALMILQKNKLLGDIIQALSEVKTSDGESGKKLSALKRRLKRNMQTDKDWKLFRQYFEQVNKDFFVKLKEINPGISPSEMKLAALIKLGFSIKETSSLLHLSEGSVRTGRYLLRKKLGLKREDNLYDYLNAI